LHGGWSTGPKTPEGRAKSDRASWKHGRRSREAVEARRAAVRELRRFRELLAEYLATEQIEADGFDVEQ
jgi:hypothetical protein